MLSELRPTLPSRWYYDPAQYQRELEAVWYRDWVCVGRSEDLAEPGDYFVTHIGDQSIIVTRDREGGLRAFHNTCRHRGSILCTQQSGRFAHGRIVCPYHSWTYATSGELLATPKRLEAGHFDGSAYSLYNVHLACWRGFIFINLADQPAQSLEDFLGEEATHLANWPLQDMRLVHREAHDIACNWKVFWENYNECYHCPRVHPALCRVVPVYGEAVVDASELPQWLPEYEGDTGQARVGNGAQSWTSDGRLAFPAFEGLTEDEVAGGVTFASFTASMFIAAHPDYVRSVRLFPTGPETVTLVVDWFLHESLGQPDDQSLAPILDFPRTVVQEDAEVCELNQRGLRSRRHEQGVLVGQEEELWRFHEWLRDRLGP
jgi:Rieske 2Fe-2S family protein